MRNAIVALTLAITIVSAFVALRSPHRRVRQVAWAVAAIMVASAALAYAIYER